MFKKIFNIFRIMFGFKNKIIKHNYPDPILNKNSYKGGRSSYRTNLKGVRTIQKRSRLKPELSAWYKRLNESQLEYYHLVRKLTNWQLSQWNKAGCLGAVEMKVEYVIPFFGKDRRD